MGDGIAEADDIFVVAKSLFEMQDDWVGWAERRRNLPCAGSLHGCLQLSGQGRPVSPIAVARVLSAALQCVLAVSGVGSPGTPLWWRGPSVWLTSLGHNAVPTDDL